MIIMAGKFQDVECPLFFRRFSRGNFHSILCDGNPDVHQLISKTSEEREQKIENICNNYEKCKSYQIVEQNY